MTFDKKFLRKNSRGVLKHVAGVEFMDYQNNNMLKKLTEYLEKKIDARNKLDDLDNTLTEIIAEYTGFRNIKVVLENTGNLGIDSGYISPSNLFNLEDIEDHLPRSESKLYQWFNDNKTKFFKGSIDFSKGKVEGSYSTIPFSIFINYNIDSFIDIKYLEKHNIKPAKALANFILHEVGHAFGGVMMMHQIISDNFLVRTATHFIGKAAYGKDKVTIIKDFAKLTNTELDDVKEIEKMCDATSNNGTYAIFLSRLITQRNTSNAAGLGVKSINSEVVADAYAIRMGGGSDMGRCLASIYIKVNRSFYTSIFISTIILTAKLIVVGVGFYFALIGIAVFYAITFVGKWTNDIIPTNYNNNYRRLMNICQEQIVKLNSDKVSDPNAKLLLIKQINESLVVAKSFSSYFEGTSYQRLIGWINKGGKFKYYDLEFYTQNVSAHGVSTLSHEFKNL